jgi:hypothetical protein
MSIAAWPRRRLAASRTAPFEPVTAADTRGANTEREIAVLKSLLTAEEAMQREQIKLDVLANNLANVNTTGFKQKLTSVQQLATRTAKDVWSRPTVLPYKASEGTSSPMGGR